jgi:deoxyribonuclease V
MSSVGASGIHQWGRSLFERQQEPVTWAGQVLEAASLSLGTTPEIDAALEMAAVPTQWSHGRELFDRVRQSSLDSEDRIAEHLLFRLAELVGKLAHNVAGPYQHFDHHAGWQIGPIAYRLTVEVQDPVLQDRLASALGSWPWTEPGTVP